MIFSASARIDNGVLKECEISVTVESIFLCSPDAIVYVYRLLLITNLSTRYLILTGRYDVATTGTDTQY